MRYPVNHFANYTRPVFAVAALLMCSASMAAEAKLTGTQFLNQAKVPPGKAEQIALAAYPGSFVSKELEKESGGSGLRYTYDIRSGKSVHEVGVDANTGSVLENSVEKGGD